MLGSSNGQDEGPAYEYPEVIHGQGKYGDNVERHINGLKGHSVSQPQKSRPTKKGYSSTKSKHPGVYSFGKSMSTIPFSFHQKMITGNTNHQCLSNLQEVMLMKVTLSVYQIVDLCLPIKKYHPDTLNLSHIHQVKSSQ